VRPTERGDHVASVAECEQAFHALAERLAGADSSTRSTASFDRSLSCALPDLGVIFAGHLKDGTLSDIRRVDTKDAQIRLSMSSDDLIRMVAGELNLGSAWASGRVKVHASVFDLIKLRTIF
jgi:putative sterol carrier protein